MEYKRFVGIDLAKRTMEVRILEEGKKTIKWNGKTDLKGRKKLYKRLNRTDCVALEAGTMTFKFSREIAKEVGAKVIILNPRNLAIIYKSLKKTDSEDALKLARLVMRNPEEELPVVPVPSKKEENDRAIVSEKRFTTEIRTKYINRLHSLFTAEGITTIKKSDLKTEKNRLTTVKKLSSRSFEEARRLSIKITDLEQEINELNKERDKALNDNELTEYVMSVPGVGPDTALAFLAYIGDGSRFFKACEVSNYIGLVPRVDCSGDTIRYGHINKYYGCSAIRRVIVQAAWALVRSKDGGPLAEKFHKLKERRGAGIAIVALARKIGELLWVLVKSRTHYCVLDIDRINSKFKSYGLKFRVDIKKGRETA